MKVLVTIPDNVKDEIEVYREKYYPDLSLSKMLVRTAVNESRNRTEVKK